MSMSSLPSSGWKQGGASNHAARVQGRMSIMPDTPLTAGQGFQMMEVRMDHLSKKMDAVLEEIRSWRDRDGPSQKANPTPVVMPSQRLQQPKADSPRTSERQSRTRPSMASWLCRLSGFSGFTFQVASQDRFANGKQSNNHNRKEFLTRLQDTKSINHEFLHNKFKKASYLPRIFRI